MKRICILLFYIVATTVYGQDKPDKQTVDSLNTQKNKIDGFNFKRKKKEEKKEDSVTIVDYKIVSYSKDTTYIDTSLTIKKEYRYNFLRKDDFELLSMANIGQGYNKLSYDFRASLYPEMGIRARHFGYFKKEDVAYYHVPTPSTELFFKTTFEQGQLLDAWIALNTSKQFNFSIAYKSLRSLGKYQHIESDHGNFRFTANYQSLNKKYRFRTHFLTQEMDSDENGGVANLEQFTSGSTQFTDRSRMDVRFQNANGKLKGNAYYLDQEYELTRVNDSVQRTSLFVGHETHYETKFYRYTQDAATTSVFGEVFLDEVKDLNRLQTFFNRAYVKLFNPYLGNLMPFANSYHYNYYFNSVLNTPDGVIGNQLKETEYALGANWEKRLGKFDFEAELIKNIGGKRSGDSFWAQTSYAFGSHLVKANLQLYSKMPNFNFLLYQSNYRFFNWSNNWDKEEYAILQLQYQSDKWGALSAVYQRINNYTFFKSAASEGESEEAFVSPHQSTGEINYFKIKYENTIGYGKFSLHNTFMYQHVDQVGENLNVPSFITRNTLAFSSHLFDKALWLQTGFTFKYFTAYKADGYHPVLGEFYTQDREEIGDFPLLDFFINAKVRRTRIYFKAEHFNSSFTGYDFYSAPNYPYRDFVIRFGLVWNFFS